MPAEEPSYRHELRALASIARFLPVFLGVMLASAFSLSVLYDTADIVIPAWKAGADLLGAYGLIGGLALPLIAWVTARLRRGRPRRVLWAEVKDDALLIDLAPIKAFARGQRLTVPLERIRGGYWMDEDEGWRRISLELHGGLTEGDRLVLELPTHLAAPICERTVGAKHEFDLTRRAYAPGIAIAILSLFVGLVSARLLLAQLVARISAQSEALTIAHSGAWASGLFVAFTGAAAALASVALRPASVAVGVDGLRIEGALRTRFVRFDAITKVAVGRLGLTLLAGGRRIRILALGAPRARLEALSAQIGERARAAAIVGAPLPVVTRRRGRRALSAAQLDEWRTRIGALSGERGYRVGAVSAEQLLGALERPGGPPEERVAAALALATRGDLESRVRIRAVASDMADEATRSLLLRVAEDEADDASIAALLSRHRQL